MIGAGIRNGDLVVICRQNEARSGQAVVALIGDEATIKTFHPERGRVVLHPENPRMRDIIVAAEECKILGVVAGCIHRFTE